MEKIENPDFRVEIPGEGGRDTSEAEKDKEERGRPSGLIQKGEKVKRAQAEPQREGRNHKVGTGFRHAHGVKPKTSMGHIRA